MPTSAACSRRRSIPAWPPPRCRRSPRFTPLGKDAAHLDKVKQNQQRRAQLQTLTALVAAAGWSRCEHPFTERITFGWHNHFATVGDEGAVSARRWPHQNQTLRDARPRRLPHAGPGHADRRGDAALAGRRRRTPPRAPNENLSREFMELFALGHGDGYTETDVREGARALTGWRIGRRPAQPTLTAEAARPDGQDRARRDRQPGPGRLLRRRAGPAGLGRYCLRPVVRPAGVRHARRTPRRSTRLTAAYGAGPRSGGAVHRAADRSPSFGQAAQQHRGRPGGVADRRRPGPARCRPTADTAAKKLAAVLRQLGQLPFYPPNVSGWPSGQAWLSTAAVDLRTAGRRRAGQGRRHLLRRQAAAASADRRRRATCSASATSPTGRLRPCSRWSADPAAAGAVALNTPEYLVH